MFKLSLATIQRLQPMGKVTLHNAVNAAGEGVILELLGEFPAVAVEISGLTAGNATITFKGSVNAKGTYYEQRALNKKTGEVSYTATTDGIYLLDVIGLSYLIADITAYTSGTITAVAQAVPLAISLPGGIIDSNGCQAVKLSGSNMELFGVNIDDRPAANTVSVGATFMIVGTDSIWQSNGTDWVVM